MKKIAPIRDVIINETTKKPLLGICLGMQMLLETSEEHGLHKGLGLIPGNVIRFPNKSGYKIPQIGWNTIKHTHHPIFAGIPPDSYVYFVHSYYVNTLDEFSIAKTDYILPYTSAVANGNIMGVQFHPEKSGNVGLKILHNFISMIE